MNDICIIDGKNTPHIRLTKDNDLIQALAAQCANQVFLNAILPWGRRSDWPVADTHGSDPRGENLPKGPVIVANQVGGRRCPGKRLSDLSGQPFSRRPARFGSSGEAHWST